MFGTDAKALQRLQGSSLYNLFPDVCISLVKPNMRRTGGAEIRGRSCSLIPARAMRSRVGQGHPGQHRTASKACFLGGCRAARARTSRPSGEIDEAQPKFPDNLNLGVDQRKLAVLTQLCTAERRARPAANRCFCTCKPRLAIMMHQLAFPCLRTHVTSSCRARDARLAGPLSCPAHRRCIPGRADGTQA